MSERRQDSAKELNPKVESQVDLHGNVYECLARGGVYSKAWLRSMIERS